MAVPAALTCEMTPPFTGWPAGVGMAASMKPSTSTRPSGATITPAFSSLSVPDGTYVDQVADLPSAASLAANATSQPELVVGAGEPGVVGKSVDQVCPLTTTPPPGASARPMPMSPPEPPSRLDQRIDEPLGATFTTYASLSPLSTWS